MKDIEKILQSAKRVAPKRQVSASFTHDVLNRINAKEERNSIFMKIYKKPLGTALSIALVLASGSAAFAAAANWPSIVSIFGGEQPLDSGARVVKIESEGCKPVDGSEDASKRVSYYEIKKGSSLTNGQAVAMMQGVCEEERVQSRVGELVQETGGAAYSTRILKIESKDAHSLTVSPDSKYDPTMNGGRKTYRVASDLKVSDGTSDFAFEKLKAGDSVVLVVVDERGISTEKQGYVEDPTKVQVKAILKVPALTGSPDLFYKYLGKDFVRVKPSKDGKGFDRVYEFDQK